MSEINAAPAPFMNNAEAAIKRQKANTPGWEQNVEIKMHAMQGIAQPAPAPPPTNAQRAVYICHQAGVRPFVPLITELLNRLESLENVNVAQARRLADLELAAHTRRKTA